MGDLEAGTVSLARTRNVAKSRTNAQSRTNSEKCLYSRLLILCFRILSAIGSLMIS